MLWQTPCTVELWYCFFFKQEREVIGACALAPEITLILIDRNRALLTDAYIILCFNKA